MESERDIVEVRKPNGRIVKVLRRDASIYIDKGFELIRCGTPSGTEEGKKPKPVSKKVEIKKADG